MIDVLDVAVIATSLPVLSALVCRLGVLHPSLHRFDVCALHAALAIAVGWGMVKALAGASDFGGLAGVVGAGAWVAISFHTWRHGVPDHYKRQPVRWPTLETDP